MREEEKVELTHDTDFPETLSDETRQAQSR